MLSKELQMKYKEVEDVWRNGLISEDEYLTRLILIDMEVESEMESWKQEYLEKKFHEKF